MVVALRCACLLVLRWYLLPPHAAHLASFSSRVRSSVRSNSTLSAVPFGTAYLRSGCRVTSHRLAVCRVQSLRFAIESLRLTIRALRPMFGVGGRAYVPRVLQPVQRSCTAT